MEKNLTGDNSLFDTNTVCFAAACGNKSLLSTCIETGVNLSYIDHYNRKGFLVVKTIGKN